MCQLKSGKVKTEDEVRNASGGRVLSTMDTWELKGFKENIFIPIQVIKSVS